MFSGLKGLVAKKVAPSTAIPSSSSGAPPPPVAPPRPLVAAPLGARLPQPTPSPINTGAAVPTAPVAATTSTPRTDASSDRVVGVATAAAPAHAAVVAAAAPLGSLLKSRLLFIDECLMRFASEAADDASSSSSSSSLLLTVPRTAEALSWAEAFIAAAVKRSDALEAATKAPSVSTSTSTSAAGEEPAAKRSRAEGCTPAAAGEGADVPSATNPAAAGIRRDAAGHNGSALEGLVDRLLSSNASASSEILADLLKSLFSFDGLVERAVEAEGDCHALNVAATRQGQLDATVAQAVVVAMKRSVGTPAMNSFELTTEWDTSVPTAIVRLLATSKSASSSSCSSTAKTLRATTNDGECEISEEAAVLKHMPLTAAELILASNTYTALMLVVEREHILREVMAYQHRWMVSEGRRITTFRARSVNEFLPAHARVEEPWPTTSAYVRAVREALVQTNAAMRHAIGGGGGGGSSAVATTPKEAVAKLYATLFSVPAAVFSRHNGTPTPYMLLESVSAPSSAAASQYVARMAAGAAAAISSEQQPLPAPPALSSVASLFPTADVYRQCLLASRGDLRARIDGLIDTLDGYGTVVEAMQRDALAIRALQQDQHQDQQDKKEGEEEEEFAVRVNLRAEVTGSNSGGAAAPLPPPQLKQLVEGTVSLALPEKLRTTTVSIGVRLAYTLMSVDNTVVVLNDLVQAVAMEESNAAGGGEVGGVPMRLLLDRRLTTLRSGVQNRTMATEDVYFSYTIGNEKWAMGIVGDSLHMRRSLEKIQNVRIAHVMNNSLVQAAMIGLKQLITFVGSRCNLEARLK